MEMLKKISNGVQSNILRVPESELLVKDATSLEKWGPTATQMRDIAKLTFKRDDFLIVMNTLMRRLNEPGKNWRHVYKALLVIDYILKNGSRDVESYCRQHIVEIRTLTRFQYIDQALNKDVGLNVRERTKIVLELINDSAKLEAERKRSSAARNKYVGVSSEDAGYGGHSYRSSSSYSSSSSTSISYDDPYDEYQGGRDEAEDDAPAADDYEGVGMENEVSYDYDYADSTFTQREEKKTKPAEQKPQSTVMLDLFGDTTTTTTSAPAPAPATTTGGSFFDMAPAAPAAATSTTTTGGSFFDMAPAAPATSTAGGSFFDMTPTTTTAAASTSAVGSSSSSNDFFGGSFGGSSSSAGSSTMAMGFTTAGSGSGSAAKTSSDPFPAAFGDFEAAGSKPAAAAAGAAKGSASFDVLSMVNLDSLGAKPSAGSAAAGQNAPQKRTPMGAMGQAARPASNAMGAPSMAPSSGGILTPTVQPNYAALSQQPQQQYGMMGGYGAQTGMYGQQQAQMGGYGGMNMNMNMNMGMGMGGYGYGQNQQNGFF